MFPSLNFLWFWKLFVAEPASQSLLINVKKKKKKKKNGCIEIWGLNVVQTENCIHIFVDIYYEPAWIEASVFVLLWENSWQVFFIIFAFFSFYILIHLYQKSQVLVERERDALRTRLSALVLTVFLVHDKPKIKCFAIFSLVKITKQGIARYVCHRIADSPHLVIHTSSCLTNHRKWIDLLKPEATVCLRQRCSCGEGTRVQNVCACARSLFSKSRLRMRTSQQERLFLS